MTYQEFIKSVKNEKPGRGSPELFIAILEQRLVIEESEDRKIWKAKKALATVNEKINEANNSFSDELADDIEFWAYEVIDSLIYVKKEQKEYKIRTPEEGDTKLTWNGDVQRFTGGDWVTVEDATDEDLKMDDEYKNGHHTLEGLKK